MKVRIFCLGIVTMKPTWIIESHLGDQVAFDAIVAYLISHHYPYHTMRFVPFSREPVGEVPKVEGPCIVYGGAGVATLAQNQRWAPGLWTGLEFAPAEYSKHLGSLYLNHEQLICPLDQVVNNVSGCGWTQFFMRPNDDLKAFPGRPSSVGSVRDWVEQMRKQGVLDENNVTVCIAPIREIGREWRTVVVNGWPVAWSLYKQYKQRRDEPTIEPEALETIREAVKLYAPADVFVADVCETADGMKIVEYNTFNSAGLYACDLGKVIGSVSNFVMRPSRVPDDIDTIYQKEIEEMFYGGSIFP
jgi:hypothetical protein